MDWVRHVFSLAMSVKLSEEHLLHRFPHFPFHVAIWQKIWEICIVQFVRWVQEVHIRSPWKFLPTVQADHLKGNKWRICWKNIRNGRLLYYCRSPPSTWGDSWLCHLDEPSSCRVTDLSSLFVWPCVWQNQPLPPLCGWHCPKNMSLLLLKNCLCIPTVLIV